MTDTSATPALTARDIPALARSADFDTWNMSDFRDRDFDRELCSFLLTTEHPELFVGITFPKSDFGVLDLEVSVVEQIGGVRRRKPLSYISREFAVLRQYSRAGHIINLFMKDDHNWGSFKKAITELVEGEIIQ